MMKRSNIRESEGCCPCMHFLVHEIAGFNELIGRKKSLLPDWGTRTLKFCPRLLEWVGGLCDKCIAVVGARVLSCKSLWDWGLHMNM